MDYREFIQENWKWLLVLSSVALAVLPMVFVPVGVAVVIFIGYLIMFLLWFHEDVMQ